MFCLCEHKKHFDKCNDSHAYCTEQKDVTEVNTIFGKFDICKECQETCIKDYIIKE